MCTNGGKWFIYVKVMLNHLRSFLNKVKNFNIKSLSYLYIPLIATIKPLHTYLIPNLYTAHLQHCYMTDSKITPKIQYHFSYKLHCNIPLKKFDKQN